MSAQHLKEAYGKGNTRSALNAAIRDLFPGTNELIDLRTWLNARPDSPEKFRTCRTLDRYLLRCENTVREKYGMSLLPIEDTPAKADDEYQIGSGDSE
jgi:hypothetical protein